MMQFVMSQDKTSITPPEAGLQLSVEQSSNYEHVKEAILKAYKLVPEAYRQKFRNYLKYDSKTHVEFAREKENLFNRWCHSKDRGRKFSVNPLILQDERTEIFTCPPKPLLVLKFLVKLEIKSKVQVIQSVNCLCDLDLHDDC